MKLLIKNMYLIAIAIMAFTVSSCNDDEGTDDLPEIIVGFTQTIDNETGIVTFINISENADTYSWDFGDGTTSTEINPEKAYENGTYTVVLTATNSEDQSESTQDEISIQVPEVVTLPITFDNENVAYDASVFGGTSFGLVDNPDVSGSNDKASIVGSITNSGAAFEGLFFDLGAQIDLSVDQAIKMNFWSESAIDILMKLEEGTAGAVETVVSHGGTGWESITFNFSSEAQYSRLTFFVDGPGTTAGTFFFDDVEQTERLVIPVLPTIGAPAPTQEAANVISVYSDVYTDVARDGFNLYGAAAFEEVQIAGNSVLKYTATSAGGGTFQVIELGGANQIDAAGAGMTNFRFDIWFPNELNPSSDFLMKLVDFGATTSEALLNVNGASNPPISQGSWLQFDFPFSELQSKGLAGSSNIQQVVIDLVNSGEVYIDNIYFYKTGSGGGGGGAPTSPAPTPTQAAADVISIYSDAYTNVPRDGFNFYGAAAFEEVQISGNGALKYTFSTDGGGNFQVIELGGANQIDAAGAGMTNFRFDIWFPNEIDASSAFLMKLVNFGTATSEAQININATSNPAIAQGSWLQFDIPFSELQSNGLAASGNIQQVVIDLLTSGEVYIDNIYFYGSGGGGGGGGGGGTEPSLPLGFENGETMIAFDGGAFALNADNPDMNGNPSAKVLQFNKIVGSAWYSGVVFDEALRSTPIIDLADGTTFKIKIWSPKAGITVRFQLEGGAAPAYEVFQTLNTANEWVTLTFDFASQVNTADTYPRFSIFPDFDTSNQVDVTVEAIYYIDDITQE